MTCFPYSQLRWSFCLGITLSEAEVAAAHISQELCPIDVLSESKDLILALRYGDLKKYHFMYIKGFI